MDERELVDALCDVRPEWCARREAIHRSGLYYVDGSRLGRELMEAVLDGRDASWMRAAFEVIEQALERGSSSTRNLIVVGLFEAMQGPAYRRADPPDLADAWLGAASRVAWADLIEGWTGDGIRTIEAWRRVVVNGPRHRIELTTAALRLCTTLGDAPSVIWQRDEIRGGRPLTSGEAARALAPIRPLVACRLLDPSATELGPTIATLEVDGAQGRTVVEFGAACPDGRVARCGDRMFVVDLDALSVAWAWLTEPTQRDGP